MTIAATIVRGVALVVGTAVMLSVAACHFGGGGSTQSLAVTSTTMAAEVPTGYDGWFE
jgi:hypothetical protein